MVLSNNFLKNLNPVQTNKNRDLGDLPKFQVFIRNTMINEFETLSAKEKELLFQAPVLVSLLSTSADPEVKTVQKADAIQLAHLKTFTANPLLIDYYNEVEKTFTCNFESLSKKYTPSGTVNRDALKEEIKTVNILIGKLKPSFAAVLHESLTKYAAHVKQAEHSVVEDFLFPLPIHGLTGI